MNVGLKYEMIMKAIANYKDISVIDFCPIVNGYAERYIDGFCDSIRSINEFSALMAVILDRVCNWRRKLVMTDAEQIGVHKLRMKVGIDNKGIKQILYRDTECGGYSIVFDIEFVYDGFYDLNENICDVLHVNMEVFGC